MEALHDRTSGARRRAVSGWVALGIGLYAAVPVRAQTDPPACNGRFLGESVITEGAVFATSVFAADLDGDGDADVLSAFQHGLIAWYENTDGQGTFGPQRVITTDGGIPVFVLGVDLDGDADIDVLSASFADDKLAWYENTDGLGTFGPKRVIAGPSFATILGVAATDVDGDADMDVLTGGSRNIINWYENTDGLGTFSSPHTVIHNYNAISIFATDVDGDGDADVLAASQVDSNAVVWVENTDGLGTFGPQQVIATIGVAAGARSVFAADLDGDGDLDVLSASGTDDKIAWYENTDGLVV